MFMVFSMVLDVCCVSNICCEYLKFGLVIPYCLYMFLISRSEIYAGLSNVFELAFVTV
jgi:hypothetical protein